MGQPQPQVGSRTGWTSDRVVAIPRDVRVVYARDCDVRSRHLEFPTVVGQIQPAALGERRP